MIERFLFYLTAISLSLASCTGSYDNITVSNTEVQSKKLIVVDVRTSAEWNQDGHADCAVNYPLSELEDHLEAIRGFDKVIVVCRSGKRAESAKTLLTTAGFSKVENHGSWKNIQCTP